jgi:hypothetical protein
MPGDQIFTMREVTHMLIDVGFGRKRQARVGAAIAMCEAPGPRKNGNPTANFSLVGDQDLANDKWGYSYGGFQIRSLRSQKGTGGFRDEEKLLDPVFNCQAAKYLHSQSGWTPWSTFTSGMYKAYLQDLYPPPPGTYIVLAGDTLSFIAEQLNTDWTDLARLNGLHDPYRIYIGQQLVIA